MTRIVLASASPRRQSLLSQIGLAYEVVVSGVDETESGGLSPEERVLELAEKKAMSVASSCPDAVVIGADTVVLADGCVLEKPNSKQEALDMLTLLSGREHDVLTGMVLVGDGGREIIRHCERTTVSFRDIDPWEKQWYIDSNEHYDKAGAYGIQGKAAVFVKGVQGCYFNVVGLPLSALFQMLKEWGVLIENLMSPS